jgi:hypothetical protein
VLCLITRGYFIFSHTQVLSSVHVILRNDEMMDDVLSRDGNLPIKFISVRVKS